MNQATKLAPYILIALSLIGLGDTLYLSYFAYLNAIPGCAIGGCETVLTSVYSKLFGTPLAYIGLVYYAYLLGLSFLLAAEPNSKMLSLATLAYTGVGVLCSAVFIYIQGALIGAWCMYCLISAALTAALFLVALWHYRDVRAIELRS
ncbi:MAG TPA: vitamin K epoxide reductase family protein [Candidatus Paceibacterota bacterium]|nr:vitamin K epoxide reductase family protein [Candidatus Paceibacterota bacterium]